MNLPQATSVGDTVGVNWQQEGHSSITHSIPKQTMADGVQGNHSFDSIASFDSTTEMAQYFPDERRTGASSIRHQHVSQGQPHSAATSNQVLPTNINATHVSVASLPSTINQRQPIPATAAARTPVYLPQMAHQHHQQHQQNVPPSASRPAPSGIPSYESQVEGLSVAETLVNDVLVNLQSKLINENLQDYGESGSDVHLEPIEPIHIAAPQPTLVLQSDYNRLRAELNSRVRPPVVYRHPANANASNQFQQNASHSGAPQGFRGDFGPASFGHR